MPYVFQSTLPHGERQPFYCLYVAAGVFQSTLPHGERRALFIFIAAASGFNPRSRMGSDMNAVKHFDPLEVSIHAPAWGATLLALAVAVTLRVSIHAPAWGATAGRADLGRVPAVSIHAPAWGATWAERERRDSSQVSIHAPAWGATLPLRHLRPRQGSFNPRSRMGSDAVQDEGHHVLKEFQSTLPHGERQ